MSDDRRPSPEELLARAREEADRARRGRLKLFFGAALVAWVATFAGVLRRIVGQARRG